MAEVQIAPDPQVATVNAGVQLNAPEEVGAVADENGVGTQDVMANTEAPAKPQHPTRIYFLRMPKPDTSDLEFRKEQVETELKAYKQACSKALAAAKLAHERKLQRKEEHGQSNEQFQVSKLDRNTLRDRLRPVSDLSRQVRDQRRDINDRKSQLPASTVAELDQKITELEFKQAHEPMDRRDENNLIADIRKLKKCRPDVARFEMEYQAVESTKDEVATFKSTKADLEKQLDVVNEEFSLAKTQMDAKWTLYQESLEQHDAVSKEFTRLKEHQETKYKEAKELRDLISSQQNGYYENRRFSQSVRTMLTKGQMEEAQAQCQSVSEGHIATLLTDPEAWKEYVASWELTRKYAVSQAAIDVSGPSTTAKSKAQREAGTASVANSDAIIADIMAEIEGRAPAKSAAQVAAQNVTMPDPEAAAPKAAKANGKKPAAKAAALDVSTPAAEAVMKRAAEESKAEKAEKSAPAPAKVAAPPATEAASKPAATKVKARAAALFEDEPFVPPAMYLSKQAPEPTAAEQKANIRKEQMAKAAEAEARKKQQAERKTKKVEKAKEQAKLREKEEEQRKAVEKVRIEKEAAAQRSMAAKKKEAQARKAALTAERKVPAKSARSMPVSKSKASKSTLTSKLYTYGVPIGAGVALCASAGMVYFFSITS